MNGWDYFAVKVINKNLLKKLNKTIKKFIKPGCPKCGSKNWLIENIAIGAYVPRAYCKDCKHCGNVEIGSKYDKKEYGGVF